MNCIDKTNPHSLKIKWWEYSLNSLAIGMLCMFMHYLVSNEDVNLVFLGLMTLIVLFVNGTVWNKYLY